MKNPIPKCISGKIIIFNKRVNIWYWIECVSILLLRRQLFVLVVASWQIFRPLFFFLLLNVNKYVWIETSCVASDCISRKDLTKSSLSTKSVHWPKELYTPPVTTVTKVFFKKYSILCKFKCAIYCTRALNYTLVLCTFFGGYWILLFVFTTWYNDKFLLFFRYIKYIFFFSCISFKCFYTRNPSTYKQYPYKK